HLSKVQGYNGRLRCRSVLPIDPTYRRNRALRAASGEAHFRGPERAVVERGLRYGPVSGVGQEGTTLELKDRVAIITGSSMGIGEAIARAYARAGARLIVNARSQERVQHVARSLQDEGHDAVAVVGDA